MPKITLPSISELKKKFTQFQFEEHETFYWSPSEKTVYYDPVELNKESGLSQLLHEVSHGLLGHQYFTSGVQLLKIEVSAWKKAETIASEFGFKISQQHIQHCLSTYRYWLRQRSLCPSCSNVALEVEENYYHCFNCLQKWKVPAHQQLRNYRLKLTS